MFMFGLVFMFLWIPILVVVGALGVALIVRCVTAPAWMRRGAACAGCGYELTALGDGRCPECGASLVKVGVTTPRLAVRIRGSMFMLFSGWTLLSVAVVVPVLSVIGYYASMSQMQQFATMGGAQRGVIQTRLIPNGYWINDLQRKRQTQDYWIDLNVDLVTADSFTLESGTATLTFDKDRGSHELVVDLMELSWQLSDNAGTLVQSGDTFDAKAARGVYDVVGLDTTSIKSNSEEAEYLVAFLSKYADDPMGYMAGNNFSFENPLSEEGGSTSWMPSGGGGFVTANDPYETAMLIAVGISGVLYVIGLVLLVMKRAKLLGRPVAA